MQDRESTPPNTTRKNQSARSKEGWEVSLRKHAADFLTHRMLERIITLDKYHSIATIKDYTTRDMIESLVRLANRPAHYKIGTIRGQRTQSTFLTYEEAEVLLNSDDEEIIRLVVVDGKNFESHLSFPRTDIDVTPLLQEIEASRQKRRWERIVWHTKQRMKGKLNPHMYRSCMRTLGATEEEMAAAFTEADRILYPHIPRTVYTPDQIQIFLEEPHEPEEPSQPPVSWVRIPSVRWGCEPRHMVPLPSSTGHVSVHPTPSAPSAPSARDVVDLPPSYEEAMALTEDTQTSRGTEDSEDSPSPFLPNEEGFPRHTPSSTPDPPL